MKMGTRVSQYVHFIIYQTATETRGGGCDGLPRKEKREVVLLEVEGLQDGRRGKGVMSRCWWVGWKGDGKRMGQLGLKMFAGMVEKELERSCSGIMGLKKSL